MKRLVMLCTATMAVQKCQKENQNGMTAVREHGHDHANIFLGDMILNGIALVELRNAKVVPTNSDGAVTTVQSTQNKKFSFSDIEEVASKDDSSNERNNEPNIPVLRESASVRSVTSKLENAADAGHRLRFRITLFTTVFGAFMLCLVVALGHATGSPWFFSMVPVFGPLIFLGIMPVDIVFVRAATAFIIFLGIFQSVMEGLNAYNIWFVEREKIKDYEDEIILDPCGANLPDSGCLTRTISEFNNAFITIAGVVYMVPNLVRVKGTKFYNKNEKKGLKFQDSAFRIPCRVALERIWFIARVFIFLQGLNTGAQAVIHFSLGDRSPWYTREQFTAQLITCTFDILVAILFTKSNRMLFTAFLAAITTTADTRNAAGIAALMGSISPKDGLTMAKQKFCAISFDKLQEADFDDNMESEEDKNKLFEDTVSVALGKCDAFMSHSWRDDGKKKYQALSKWSEDFKTQHGRYPLIWLDKACIDQNNIATDLMCLPIFLAGCKELLIIPGPTYTSRLWCVMEVFVFLHMGGNIQRIKVLPIDIDDVQQVSVIFSSVDISQADCYLEEDKQRLLAVVQMGFGSFSSFNETVRNMFNERLSSFRSSYNTKRDSGYRVDSISDSSIESDRVRD